MTKRGAEHLGQFFTKELATERLKMWLDAEAAVATGQSYQIGTRRLDRANLHQIREQINYWQKELLKAEGKRQRRVTRVVPRDL